MSHAEPLATRSVPDASGTADHPGLCHKGSANRHTGFITELTVGYCRVSTVDQDLTAQRDALTALGVDPKRIYSDRGLTGTNRARLGLREALAACRRGDTLVVTKLDRLARSVLDARDTVDELTAAGVRLNIGGSVHDPNASRWPTWCPA